ncbi:MAG: DnaJ domain-containing protein, partial [Neisseria sp.]|nr:DnaJ domain-containing protein [Neisseria sp.]
MTEKTHYEILGVDKTADAETIKKAYRKLVRKYHPDVSKEPDAAERTAEINTAYETLSDQEKRAEYDQMLANPYGRGTAG